MMGWPPWLWEHGQTCRCGHHLDDHRGPGEQCCECVSFCYIGKPKAGWGGFYAAWLETPEGRRYLEEK